MTKKTRIVLAFGTFDILHLCHIHLFKQAKQLGGKLVVVVARDCNVKKIKGQAPLHNEKERLEFLRHIDLVDEVVLGDKRDMYKVVQKIKPDVIALGYDQVVDVSKLGGYIIKRLRPYKTKKAKSNKIKKYIEGMI